MAENDKEKKKKKKGSGAGLFILILLLIIAVLLALLLLDPFGWGLGGFGGSGSSQASSGQAQNAAASQNTEDTEADIAPDEPQTVNIEVTVKGATYIMNDNEVTIDDIVAEAKSHENDDVIVTVRDDSATLNSVDDLRNALDKESIQCVIVSADQ